MNFWDYYRQVFFGSGVTFPDLGLLDELSRQCVLETIELQAAERALLSLQLPRRTVLDLLDICSRIQLITSTSRARRLPIARLSLVFSSRRAGAGRATMHPGPLRLSLDNRAERRVLPGFCGWARIWTASSAGRRPVPDGKAASYDADVPRPLSDRCPQRRAEA